VPRPDLAFGWTFPGPLQQVTWETHGSSPLTGKRRLDGDRRHGDLLKPAKGITMNNLTEFRPVTLPLSAKDVFSFLVPGATLIVLVYLYEFWSEKYFFAASESFRTPLYTALTSTATPDNWAYMLLYFLGVIASAYVTGHAVSWISVFFIDRIIVGRGHGYPYEHLLRIRKKPTRPTGRIGSFFYRGLFFWLNLYLGVMFVSMFKVFLPVDFWASVARFLGWACIHCCSEACVEPSDGATQARFGRGVLENAVLALRSCNSGAWTLHPFNRALFSAIHKSLWHSSGEVIWNGPRGGCDWEPLVGRNLSSRQSAASFCYD
jgi:hypothetical protein